MKPSPSILSIVLPPYIIPPILEHHGHIHWLWWTYSQPGSSSGNKLALRLEIRIVEVSKDFEVLHITYIHTYIQTYMICISRHIYAYIDAICRPAPASTIRAPAQHFSRQQWPYFGKTHFNNSTWTQNPAFSTTLFYFSLFFYMKLP